MFRKRDRTAGDCNDMRFVKLNAGWFGGLSRAGPVWWKRGKESGPADTHGNGPSSGVDDNRAEVVDVGPGRARDDEVLQGAEKAVAVIVCESFLGVDACQIRT